MRSLYILLVISTFVETVQGQNTFEKLYSGTGSYQFTLNELSNNNILVGMGWGPGVTMINAEGNVLHSGHYWYDDILQLGSVRRYTDNEFYFVTGYRKDSCTMIGSNTLPYVHPAVGRMDSLGNVQMMRYYELNEACTNSPSDLIVNNDKSMIVWGREDRFFILKIDSIGNPIWAKRFVDQGSIQFIKQISGGDLLVGFNMDETGASVARLDADGNTIWCNSYIRPSGRAYDAVVQSDTAFIIVGMTETTDAQFNIPLPSSYAPKLFMMKLDGAGDVLWCKGYASETHRWYAGQWARMKMTLDGNYVVLATIGVHENGFNFNFFDKPFMMKTDTNGDTTWTRSVGSEDHSYYTRDLLASADGGFLFNGIVWGDLPEGNSGLRYIFKTDSLGHFSCQERYHPVQVLDLFPTDSSFTLTSIDGATVHPAIVSDTTFAPIAVYDACLVTSVPSYHTSKQRSVRVYPNPTPGRFNLEFSDPLLRDSYYSVYDATGRLLLQRPLPTGATLEEVDLSRFGRGAYVLRLTDPEGVRHERVVVE